MRCFSRCAVVVSGSFWISSLSIVCALLHSWTMDIYNKSTACHSRSPSFFHRCRHHYSHPHQTLPLLPSILAPILSVCVALYYLIIFVVLFSSLTCIRSVVLFHSITITLLPLASTANRILLFLLLLLISFNSILM